MERPGDPDPVVDTQGQQMTHCHQHPSGSIIYGKQNHSGVPKENETCMGLPKCLHSETETLGQFDPVDSGEKGVDGQPHPQNEGRISIRQGQGYGVIEGWGHGLPAPSSRNDDHEVDDAGEGAKEEHDGDDDGIQGGNE